MASPARPSPLCCIPHVRASLSMSNPIAVRLTMSPRHHVDARRAVPQKSSLR